MAIALARTSAESDSDQCSTSCKLVAQMKSSAPFVDTCTPFKSQTALRATLQSLCSRSIWSSFTGHFVTRSQHCTIISRLFSLALNLTIALYVRTRKCTRMPSSAPPHNPTKYTSVSSSTPRKPTSRSSSSA
uniref:(northern house mosquito) hypothetical protein n=1 Tax=Culex pipiens TaxID=7175 RepID=A0A8D8DQI0_CULPI